MTGFFLAAARLYLSANGAHVPQPPHRAGLVLFYLQNLRQMSVRGASSPDVPPLSQMPLGEALFSFQSQGIAHAAANAQSGQAGPGICTDHFHRQTVSDSCPGAPDGMPN